MDMRRRSRGDGGRGESADERLDRLIAMERRARSTPPPGEEQHELRRLKMVPEGSEGSAVSGDAAAAHGGQRGRGDSFGGCAEASSLAPGLRTASSRSSRSSSSFGSGPSWWWPSSTS